MPELPEVETVRRGLAPDLTGRRIAHVDLRRPDLRIPFPPGFAQGLEGTAITGLRRRAKYLLADLDSGDTLIMHLGMSGRLTWAGAADDLSFPHYHQTGGAGAHDHVVFAFDGGGRLVFNDPRRFGLMTLAPAAALDTHKLFAHLGPEPLGEAFDADYLHAALRARKTAIKAALLDQRLVVGVGNIYASEALHRARISPLREAGRVSRARVTALTQAIKDVLEEAIAAGGSSLRDYVHADGSLGYFQHAFQVYDREAVACPRNSCAGAPVRRIVQAGRSTFYCPRCQR